MEFSRIQLSVLYLYELKTQFNILRVSPIQNQPHEPWQNCSHPHDHADILSEHQRMRRPPPNTGACEQQRSQKQPIQRGNTNSHACSYTGSNETYFKEHNSDLHTATTRSEETGGLHYNPVTATECDWNHTRAHIFFADTHVAHPDHMFRRPCFENIANT